MSEARMPEAEPWLRGTLNEVEAVARAVLHALELAKEDLKKWCGPLSDEQLNRSVAGLAPVAFHLRHIARSVDRLLTYAKGAPLNELQRQALKTELAPGASSAEVFRELESALELGAQRVRELAREDLAATRLVGARKLATTLGGLLVHVAEHTQRHVGQAITTAKLVSRGEAF